MDLLVNGEAISAGDIQAEANRLRPQYFMVMQQQGIEASEEELEAQLQKWARENLIERTVLRQAAMTDEEPLDPERVVAAMEQIRNQLGGEEQFRKSMEAWPEACRDMEQEVETQLRLERYLEQVTREVTPPKANEVAEFYRRHRDRFERPERWFVRHIIKKLPEQNDETATAEAYQVLTDALAELREGAAFESVAERYSDTPGKGGEIGWISRGELVGDFEERLMELEVGVVSEIFRTQFGLHIARLDEHEAARQLPLSEVREMIAERLLSEKKEGVIERHLDRLMAQATVEAQQTDAPAGDRGESKG